MTPCGTAFRTSKNSRKSFEENIMLQHTVNSLVDSNSWIRIRRKKGITHPDPDISQTAKYSDRHPLYNKCSQRGTLLRTCLGKKLRHCNSQARTKPSIPRGARSEYLEKGRCEKRGQERCPRPWCHEQLVHRGNSGAGDSGQNSNDHVLLIFH